MRTFDLQSGRRKDAGAAPSIRRRGQSRRIVGGFLLVLLVGWPGLASTSSAAEGGEVQELLASPDPGRWLYAVDRLGASNDVTSLIHLLHEDPRKVVRTAAALVLAGFQEKRVVEALVQALGDQEAWVRLAAVEALAYIGGDEVKGPLQQALQDQDQDIRKAAQDALARLRDDKEVPFSTVDQGTSSGIKEQAFLVIKTEREWRGLWSRHRASEPPPIDFSREMAIAIFIGEQRTGGFQVEIRNVEDKGGFLKVVVQTIAPVPGSSVLQVLAQPYHIIKLERKEIPVRFSRRTRLASLAPARD